MLQPHGPRRIGVVAALAGSQREWGDYARAGNRCTTRSTYAPSGSQRRTDRADRLGGQRPAPLAAALGSSGFVQSYPVPMCGAPASVPWLRALQPGAAAPRSSAWTT